MTAIGGAGSQAVQAEHAGRRPWIEGFPVCRPLTKHGIIHVGIYPRLTPTRDCSHPAITYFLAGFRGKGRVLINDQRQILKPNYGCWLSASANFAFEPMPGSGWRFCWVCFNRRPAYQMPSAGTESVHLAPFETLPLQSAIAGLLHECNGPGQPFIIQKWTDLVHAYVLSFAETRSHALASQH